MSSNDQLSKLLSFNIQKDIKTAQYKILNMNHGFKIPLQLSVFIIVKLF